MDEQHGVSVADLRGPSGAPDVSVRLVAAHGLVTHLVYGGVRTRFRVGSATGNEPE